MSVGDARERQEDCLTDEGRPSPQGHEAADDERAREVVQRRPLPDRRPDRSWGGLSAGTHCAICNTPVHPGEPEFEFEFVRDGGAGGTDTYHAHIRCYSAWISERRDP